MSPAALANGLFLGELPLRFRNATFVELMAASPVRVSGMVIALEQVKMNGIPGSAQRLMSGTFTFYFQDAYAVQQRLPACDTDVVGSFTCALVGRKPRKAQLLQFFGAERDVVHGLVEYLLDRNNDLAGVHTLARRAHRSDDNLSTYTTEREIPEAIMNALICRSLALRSRWRKQSLPRGNREPEVNDYGDSSDADDVDLKKTMHCICCNGQIETGHPTFSPLRWVFHFFIFLAFRLS